MVISSRANARVAFLVHDSLRDGEEMHKTDGGSYQEPKYIHDCFWWLITTTNSVSNYYPLCLF